MLTFRAATLIVLVTLTLINDSFSETRMTQRFLVKRAAHEKPEGNTSPPRLPGGGQGAGSQRQFGGFGLEKLHRFVRSPQNNPPTLMMAEGMPQGPPSGGHHPPPCGHHGPHGPGGSPPPSPDGNTGEGATTTNA